MALNNKQIATLIFMPLWYGIERTFKAASKIEFAMNHQETSGYAKPVSLIRNGAVAFFGVLGAASCGISGGIAMGAAFGSVVPVFGTLVGALLGAVITGLLGCTAGTLVTKHLFRLGTFMANTLTDQHDRPSTNAGKYNLADNLRSSRAQTLLREIGRKKAELKQAAGGNLLTVIGDKALFFNPNQKRCSDSLNKAVKILHENPSDAGAFAEAQGHVLASSVGGVLGGVEATANDFVRRFR